MTEPLDLDAIKRVHATACNYHSLRGTESHDHRGQLLAEVERLARDNRVLQLKAGCSLANNLCPDHRDKQAGKSCLACEIERLRARVVELEHDIERAIGNHSADLSDAARYRYLRDDAGNGIMRTLMRYASADAWDRTVDAAMSEGNDNGSG